MYYRILKVILIQSIGMIINYFVYFIFDKIGFFFSISLVIIGGDGSVINVINALIRYLAKENRTR
jgi:hypothetical protein